MPVLGIESSAHTFGVGVVEAGRVLANEKAMYKITSKGMIPAEVAEHHIESAAGVIKRALDVSGLRLNDITGVGYTRGPGLGPCLQIGMLSAKTLAARLGVPVTLVNHGLAHVEITKRMTGLRDPLALYVSGGNSQILKFDKAAHRYRILGETFDIGVGNAIDSLARDMGLEHAWGSEVERLATRGRYVPMPYTVKGMDFAFSGLLTNAKGLLKKHNREDVCYSFQETAFSMLCEATERALLLTKSRELCMCGGVAQNTRLREMLSLVAKDHKTRFAVADGQFNADNGAMIALVAERQLARGAVALDKCDVKQRYRIDEVVYYG